MRLSDFSGIVIPEADASDSILASGRNNMVTLRAGNIDMDGGNSYVEAQQFGRTGWFINDLDNSVDMLRQRMSQGAGVLRALMRDNTERMTLAKISQLVTNADTNSYTCWQPYTIRFQQTYPYWMNEADGKFFDSGYLLDGTWNFDWAVQSNNIASNPTLFTINNNGSGVCPTIFIHVACGASAALSSFILYNDTNGLAFHYNTALGNNQRLIVDTLSRSVTVNYAAAYTGFGLEDPMQTNWMQLEPGVNNFRLLYTGKTNTPTIEFYFLRHYV